MNLARYELKFRIPADLEAPIRHYVSRFCIPDAANKNGRYRISSLYLDTPDHRLYNETKNRMPRRFKLRVRRYDGVAHFAEIKARIKDVVHKRRVRVPDGAWPGAFFDPRLGPDHPYWHAFVNKCLRFGVQPAAVVRYERDAWKSPTDEYARVTFDHRLCTARPQGWTVPIDGPDWLPMDHPHRYGLGSQSGVVLELKALMAVPYWMRDLIRRFDLLRSGFSKYGAAIDELAPERLYWHQRQPTRRSR
jgi:hypothetical protein